MASEQHHSTPIMYDAPSALATTPHQKPPEFRPPIIENFEFFGEGEESQMVGANENEDEVSLIIDYFRVDKLPKNFSTHRY